ncbi:hypothetical protein FB45DRAFT_1030199 [Roridomyces roridus]|uniref:Uncharacterized protein n=1 Tax=Roridomyces roridus TaxID=1738132 RepID=A0AAD7FIA9_9AGAR|nr:hypothetical protein FB45DRAFT_1030199 [Roridomyces roridus]
MRISSRPILVANIARPPGLYDNYLMFRHSVFLLDGRLAVPSVHVWASWLLPRRPPDPNGPAPGVSTIPLLTHTCLLFALLAAYASKTAPEPLIRIRSPFTMTSESFSVSDGLRLSPSRDGQ